MASYLLLRSNQKSGPYSLQDLVNHGLKPYDLVWVDGKSAAWRYPSEVEELKPYAPEVEEQPYDRFFKKNPAEKKQEVISKKEQQPTPTTITPEKPAQESPPIEERYEKYLPKKSVFVTMPGPKTVAVQRPVQVVQREPEVSEAPVISVKENPAAQVKYSQPLDEIKEMYVKTLQERKSKIARKSFILANLKRAAVIVGLIGLGVLAGFIIKSGDKNKQPLAHQNIQPATLVADPVPGEELPDAPKTTENGFLADQTEETIVNNTQSEPGVLSKPDLSPQLEERLIQLEKQQAAKARTGRRTATPVSVDNDINYEVQTVKPVENDPLTGERTRIIRSDDTKEVKAVMNPVSKNRKGGLESMVSVNSNDYTRVAFGGIRNLELTVVNDSKYMLDKVTVELQYLKPSEEPLKTELVQFNSVSPNGTMTMRIRDTNRGIKVLYKIVDIQPKQTETALAN